MNSNSQTLEMQIKLATQKAENGVKDLTYAITKLDTNVTKASATVDKNGKKIRQSFTASKKEADKLYTSITKIDKNGLKTVTTNVKSLSTGLDEAKTKAETLSKTFSFASAIGGLKVLVNQISSIMSYGVDYSEQLNLFNVAFNNFSKNGVTSYSEVGQAAIRFQNKMNEAFGTNKTETLYMQGIFQEMGLSTNISEEYSSIMSENLTKLSYDLASLYNKSETDVSEALRAGVYAGQTKPLRSYGIDVTENSTETLLASLGITDRSISDLNYAEKEVLRYVQTLKQSQNAMKDFANTVNSPANQLKIFSQQISELKVAASSLFVGMYAEILPTINGIVMAAKEVLKTIATILGISLQDYNTGLTTSDDAIIDIGDDLDSSTESAKELKKQLLSFDEVHNINEDTSSSSSSSTGTGSYAIDDRLLAAITSYDNGLESVKNKATEIRDKIMDWLGFTKLVNSETSETYFKWNGWSTALNNAKKAFEDLNTAGKIFVALGLAIVVGKIVASVKGLTTALGTSGLLGTIKKLTSPLKTLTATIKSNYDANSGLLSSMKDMKTKVNDLTTSVKDGINQWSSSLTIIDKLRNTIVGSAGLAVGFSLASDAAKEFNEQGKVTATVIGEILGSGATSIAGGALIGATYGGTLGAVIGAASGAVLSLVSYLDALKEASYETANQIISDVTNAKTSFDDFNASIDEQTTKTMTAIGNDEKYLTELNSIVDANGKIKEGYEARAEYILNELNEAYGTEYKIVDGVIQKYSELTGTIEDLIKKKKLNALITAGEEKYANAVENSSTYYKNMTAAIEEYDKEVADLDKTLKESYETSGRTSEYGSKAYKDIYNSYEEYKEAVINGEEETYIYYKKDIEKVKELAQAKEDATSTWEEANSQIVAYEDLMTASITDDQEEISTAIDNYTKENGLSLAEQIGYYKAVGDASANLKGQVTEDTYAMYNATVETLQKQTSAVDEVTEEQADAWYKLATTDKDKFLEAFTSMPSEVQQNVVDKMYEKGYSISDELQKGINSKQISGTIKFNADMSEAESTVKKGSWWSNLKDWWKSLFSSKATGGSFYNGAWHNIPQYANGGSPTHGTMFVAGEAGAEVVGHVNGRTEVLNQSQLASVMYQAVSQAMSEYSNGGVELYLHTDEGVVVDRINKKTKQTGVCPIDIPY